MNSSVLTAPAAATSECSGRVVFLYFLRVAACFMVILVHACEFYYLNSDGVFFNSASDRAWVAVLDGFCRCAVPLFVMTSSYLLLPLRYSAGTFARKRFSRIFFPFLAWSLFYAVVPGIIAGLPASGILAKTGHILANFNDECGHLWYMYMFVGIYMFMPVISPWLASASQRAEQVFIAIWFLSTFSAYLQPVFGEMWGLCAWNEFHTLYYFSGYLGYVVLAHYIRTYVDWSPRRLVAVGLPLTLVGFAITAGVFYHNGGVSLEYSYVEQSWSFCTFNVAILTTGIFLIFKAINAAPKGLFSIFSGISRLSYGIYLMHLFVLGYVFELVSGLLDANPALASTGGWSTGVCIIISALATFIVCAAVLRLIRPLPYSRFITG